MLEILYEDKDVIVAVKPAGMESQSSRSFEPDMVSEIRGHIRDVSPAGGEPYVGVVHRLDKPVSGIMVYARNRAAAAALSAQAGGTGMKKTYRAVVCGIPGEPQGRFVDYLRKIPGKNMSETAAGGTKDARRAELFYRVLDSIRPGREEGDAPLTLVEIGLVTGRHHQIRVQFAAHGLPLWGDRRYNPAFAAASGGGRPQEAQRYSSLALCACGLSFEHPSAGRRMDFSVEPRGGAFGLFHFSGDGKHT